MYKTFENYEYEGKLYNLEFDCSWKWDSITDRNDLGEIRFKKWKVEWDTVYCEEVLDNGEVREVNDTKLTGDIIDRLDLEE